MQVLLFEEHARYLVCADRLKSANQHMRVIAEHPFSMLTGHARQVSVSWKSLAEHSSTQALRRGI